MGAQSAVMMKMAGENWQYGKRRIFAMSNEDFNEMTPVTLYEIETQELRAIIPSIESSLQSMTPLTATIVTEMINTFKVGAEATVNYVGQLGDSPLGNAIKIAISIWMPWLNTLIDFAGSGITPPTPTPTPPPPGETPPTFPPSGETPPPVVAPPPGETEKDLEGKIDGVHWHDMIPSGTTRKQLQAAIKNFDANIARWQSIVRTKKLPGGGTASQAQITQAEASAKLYMNIREHYKNALTWLLGQPGAGVTTP